MGKLGIAVDFGVVALVAALAVPVAREALHWSWARLADTPPTYDAFIEDWRAGRYADEAATRRDLAAWRTARQADNADTYEAFAKAALRDTHVGEARARADQLRFAEAERRNTVRSLQTYLDHYPQGTSAAEARSRQARLRADPAPYRTALDRASAPAIKEFLAEFPGHDMQAAAEAALPDLAGRDLFDLLREKKLQLRLRPRAGGTVFLGLQRNTPHPLVVRVPRGMLLAPRERTWGTLIVPTESTITLRPTAWVDTSLQALALQSKPVWRTGPLDYAVRPPGEPVALVQVLAQAEAARSSRDVTALAVWIATLNEALWSLGYQSRAHGLREASAYEAALALQIVDKAGIDLATRAAWAERANLARQLPPGPVKSWLENAR